MIERMIMSCQESKGATGMSRINADKEDLLQRQHMVLIGKIS